MPFIKYCTSQLYKRSLIGPNIMATVHMVACVWSKIYQQTKFCIHTHLLIWLVTCNCTLNFGWPVVITIVHSPYLLTLAPPPHTHTQSSTMFITTHTHTHTTHPPTQTAASVAQEQCEAEDDVSIQQRLLMAGATSLDGAAEIVGEENEIAGGENNT